MVQYFFFCFLRDRGEAIGIIEALRRGWSKILPVAWVYFLNSVLVFSGLFLLIIPGIIFSIWFMFSGYISIVENIGGMEALLKSREYVKGNWWKILVRFFVILVLSGLVFISINAVSMLVLFVFGMSPGISSNILLLTAFLPFILSSLFAPFLVIYLFVLYEDLRGLHADLVFVPQRKQKITFSIIGIMGFLVASSILVIPIVRNYLDISKSQEIQNMIISQEFEEKKQEIVDIETSKTIKTNITSISPILVKNLSNIQEINKLGFSTSGFYTSYQGVTIEDWKEGDIFTIYPNTPYFKDRDRVHYGIKILEGVDSDSFVVYDNSFAKDKNRIYLSGIAEYPQDLDVNTFERVDFNFFKDKNRIYYSSLISDKKFGQSGYYHLEPMSGIDADSFETRVIDAYSGRYYVDKNGVYFANYGVSLEGNYTMSLDNINGADNTTFQVIGLCGFKGAVVYAKDKNNVYEGQGILEGVDVKTFGFVANFDEGDGDFPMLSCVTKDKNCIYKNDQKVLDTNGLCINPINCTEDNLASGCGLK